MVVYLINVLRPSRPELFVCLGHRQRAPLKETHLPTIGLFVSETDYLVLEEWTLNLSEISFCNSNDTTTPGSPGDRKVTKAGGCQEGPATGGTSFRIVRFLQKNNKKTTPS